MQQSKLATWWLSKSMFPLQYPPQFHRQSLQWQKGITPLLLHITHVDTVQLATFLHISYERLSQHYMLISAGTCKSKFCSTQHYRNNWLAIFHFPIFVDEQIEKKEATLWSSAAGECGHGVCWNQKLGLVPLSSPAGSLREGRVNTVMSYLNLRKAAEEKWWITETESENAFLNLFALKNPISLQIAISTWTTRMLPSKIKLERVPIFWWQDSQDIIN